MKKYDITTVKCLSIISNANNYVNFETCVLVPEETNSNKYILKIKASNSNNYHINYGYYFSPKNLNEIEISIYTENEYMVEYFEDINFDNQMLINFLIQSLYSEYIFDIFVN